MLRSMVAVVLVTAGALGAVAWADAPRGPIAGAPVPIDGIAAIVDGVSIFRSEVRARVRQAEAEPAQLRGERSALEKVLLAALIDEVLILRDAATLEIEVTDAEVTAQRAELARAANLDAGQFERVLAAAGLTVPEYDERIRRQLIEGHWLIMRARNDRTQLVSDADYDARLLQVRQARLDELRRSASIEVR